MNSFLGRSVAALFVATVLVLPAGLALADANVRDGIPTLDHVFVIVLENHNSYTSFGYPGILESTYAPHIRALAGKWNVATNYNGVWHPSLPNYIAMIAGDFTGTDVTNNGKGVAAGHSYPTNSYVGISDDDSASISVDLAAPAGASVHRWQVNKPSLAGQLVGHGLEWRAYLQNLPQTGSLVANWPGDSNTAKLYAVKHNPFPYIAEVQSDPAQLNRQVPLEQLFSDLADPRKAPAFSYIVPDQCRDMHGLGSPLAPCTFNASGVANAGYDDPADISRGDDETFWLVNAITGSPTWRRGRNALFIVFDEGNGPLTCPNYNPDTQTDTAAPNSVAPGADCYDPTKLNDKVVLIAITNYGVTGVADNTLYSHYSLLKTVEAAFGLPYLGHAADGTTNTLAPLLQPRD